MVLMVLVLRVLRVLVVPVMVCLVQWRVILWWEVVKGVRTEKGKVQMVGRRWIVACGVVLVWMGCRVSSAFLAVWQFGLVVGESGLVVEPFVVVAAVFGDGR